MNLLIIDLETSGLDAETNGIISIAAKLYDSDRKLLTSYNANCNPEGSEIDLGALKVNRFSIANIESFRSEKDIIKTFCDWLLGLKVQGELVLGGHNPHFDLGFIKSKLRKHGISGFDQAVSYRVIDTATIGRFLVLTGLISNVKVSLKELAITLGIEYDASKHHSAEYDVDLTAKLLFAMIDLVKGKTNGQNQ